MKQPHFNSLYSTVEAIRQLYTVACLFSTKHL